MVNIAVVKEVKITDPKYATKSRAGYEIWTAAVETASCRKVALIIR
jgi:hypothetical protein